MPRKINDFDWIKRHMEQLIGLGEELLATHSHITNQFRYLTCLKLCALENYVAIYTRIMTDDRLQRLGFKGRAYLDVFAGSGVNTIGETRIPVAGSSPIAARFHHEDNRFHRFYAIELQNDYADALRARMELLVDPSIVDIIEGAAEDRIQETVREIEERRLHYLAFVDYEDLKGLGWDSLEWLLRQKGDIWITFLHSMRRTLGRAQWSENDKVTLGRLVGTDVVESAQCYEDLQNGFIEKIRGHREKVVDILLDSGEGYRYQLIFATRSTWGDSPYVQAVENLKKRIERCNGIDVRKVLEQLRGGQQTLCIS